MKISLFFISFFLLLSGTQASEPLSAKNIIQSAIDNYRGVSSYSEASMTIHRPDWERTVTMKAWTAGLDKSLVRITAPIKDKNSGTLVIDNNMWSYAPKINRVIKIPASMSNQSWMGSDFSNNDVARADDLIEKYTHTILETTEKNGLKQYLIRSVPHEDAPVVWGKELLTIDSRYIVHKHEFYDQDNQLIKTMTSSNTKLIDGKYVSLKQRMQKTDTPDEWTEFETLSIQFNVPIKANTFTLYNLQNPR